MRLYQNGQCVLVRYIKTQKPDPNRREEHTACGQFAVEWYDVAMLEEFLREDMMREDFDPRKEGIPWDEFLKRQGGCGHDT